LLHKSNCQLKHLLLTFLFIVCAVNVSHSQEYMYQRGLATLSMGVAIPAYDFGSGSGINLTSHVKPGTNITGEIAYFYSWHVGLGVMFNYSVNPIDNNRLAEGYMNSSPAFKTVTAETEPFRDISGLAGFIFDIPPNEYFSFTFKLMGGLRNVYKPTTLVKTTTLFSSIDYYETHDNKTVFAFLTSMGARVIVNDHFNVHVTASYIGSTINFEYYRNHKEITQKAHVGVLTILGGVSYSF